MANALARATLVRSDERDCEIPGKLSYYRFNANGRSAGGESLHGVGRGETGDLRRILI